jgi:hypothetical protein
MSIRILSDTLGCEPSLFSVMESIDAMRFGSDDYIKQQISNAVGKVPGLEYDRSVRFMGEFTSMESCVRHIKAKTSACFLIVGSLNYLSDNENAKDIDVNIFVHDDSKSYSESRTHNDVDLMIYRYTTDDVLKQRLKGVYFVSRLFWMEREKRENKVHQIESLKRECISRGFKSNAIIPAFKGYVIAILAIYSDKSDTGELLGQLATLNTIHIKGSYMGTVIQVTLEYYTPETSISQMRSHIVSIEMDDGKSPFLKYPGNASIRRGISYSLMDPSTTWEQLDGITFSSMKHMVQYLESHHANNSVLATQEGSSVVLKYKVEDDVNDRDIDTVQFWELQFVQPAHEQTTETEEHNDFMMVMMRRNDEGKPLISRKVAELTDWSNDYGCCHCHTMATLPDTMTYTHPEGGTWKLHNVTDEAYRKHMMSWFEIVPPNGLKRFSSLIKYIDFYLRQTDRMGPDFIVYNTTTKLLDVSESHKDLFRRLGPQDGDWSKRHLMNGWRTIRSQPSSTEVDMNTDPSSPPHPMRPLESSPALQQRRPVTKFPLPSG